MIPWFGKSGTETQTLPTTAVTQAALIQRWKLRSPALAASISAWLSSKAVPDWKSFDAALAAELAAASGTPSEAIQRWVCLLVLESPELRRRMDVAVLDQIAATGVYRELIDRPNPTGCAVLVMIAAALRKDPSPLLSLGVRAIARNWIPLPSASDALFLSWALEPGHFENLLKGGATGEFLELIEMAGWLSALRGARHTPQPPTGTSVPLPPMPSTRISRSWLTTTAFRGPRRHWCRRLGTEAGTAGTTSLEPGLKPTLEHPPEACGAMLVEWTLSHIRAWPDRENLRQDDPEATTRRYAPLLAEVRESLRNVTHGVRMIRWLDSVSSELLGASRSAPTTLIRF